MCTFSLTHVQRGFVRGLTSTYCFLHYNQVVKAPEPDNIIWENLEFSKFKRRMRQSITGLISFALLLFAFGLILAASGLQDNFSQIVPKIAYCQLEVTAAKPLRMMSISFAFLKLL